MLHFENPAAFLILLVVPLFFILRKIGLFMKPAFPLTLSDWNGRVFEWKQTASSVAVVITRILTVTGFALIVIALSEPVVSRQEKVYTSRGTDIMFVLDTSPSMAAVDIAGFSRLDAAKQTIRTLVKNVPGAAFGLVSMASEAVVVVPPTLDHNSFNIVLESTVAGELGDGTALGTGISSAVYHLLSSEAPKKCIVLLTDGENNAGSVSPDTASRLAASNGITIYAAGLGTRGSVPIEYVDPKTGKVWSGFLDSQFDEATLRRTAASGNGIYFPVETLDALSSALSAIATREEVIQTYRYHNIDTYYYYQILTAAFIVITVVWILRRLLMKELV